ncbi:MAG: arginase [Planctomycetota bacterium]
MSVSPFNRKIHILGVPLDHGAGRRGVGMGPSAVRIARLHETLTRIGLELFDHGDIHISIPETLAAGDPHAKYLPVVADACRQLAEHIAAVLAGGGFPLVIGGDHSIAIGTISGLALHLRAQIHDPARAPRIGVLWFDAHADINTPDTSPSGNIHGMPLACLLNQGPEILRSIGYSGPKLAPHRVVQIGLRDVDVKERGLLKDAGVHTYTMADIDKRGIGTIVDEAVTIATGDADLLHVSFDIDALDPQLAPGTGTAIPGGLTYREAHLALEIVAACGRLRSLELVEVNPILDDKNRTAELAVGLIASALGKTIL